MSLPPGPGQRPHTLTHCLVYDFVLGLPQCFALGFRCCSEICRLKLQDSGFTVPMEHWTYLIASDTNTFNSIGFTPWLAPDYQNNPLRKFHLPRATGRLHAEIKQSNGIEDPGQYKVVKRTRPELDQNHYQLEAWRLRYTTERCLDWQLVPQKIQLANLERIRSYSAEVDESLEFSAIVATPTMSRVVSAFNESKTFIDRRCISPRFFPHPTLTPRFSGPDRHGERQTGHRMGYRVAYVSGSGNQTPV
ncbi:hypothetical protein B0H17DRAFT_1140016 [Mycena rosella]|uniref:Uncharacterized protein n=1 Tax=Mycena rosella TaxID=1033263 RepID=A0AAD7GCG6_MYCRO|nr:hypothetical protein B0H17DRAFT_1140016 [Mycena rosella]